MNLVCARTQKFAAVLCPKIYSAANAHMNIAHAHNKNKRWKIYYIRFTHMCGKTSRAYFHVVAYTQKRTYNKFV